LNRYLNLAWSKYFLASFYDADWPLSGQHPNNINGTKHLESQGNLLLWQLWANFLRNWLRSILVPSSAQQEREVLNVTSWVLDRIRATNTDRGREKISDVSMMECIVYLKPKFRFSFCHIRGIKCEECSGR
jgi:hypothetical protein